MLKSDLHPPQAGLGSDPVLYGVAAALADLFPLIVGRTHASPDTGPEDEEDGERD